MTTAKDLVDAIQSGKSATIQATFNSLMTEKIQDGIEVYRQAVIDNTFNPELVSESLDEVAYDTRTLDDKKKKQPVIARGVKGMKSTPFEKKFPSMAHYEKWADSEASGNHEVHDVRLHESEELDEELQLEDYSLDEIEEFIVSEEFDALDELSKTTLKSYYKKASADRSKAQTTAQKYSDKATTAGIKTSANTQKYKDLKGKADAAGAKMVKRTIGTDAAGKRLGYFESEEVDESGELQLEDYSLDEIEEFMMSEEFESLDELSKQTLTSYRDKAYADSSASGREGNKQLTKMDLYDKGSRKYNDHAAKFVAAGKRHAKRWTGADRASEKLDKMGEEVESVDELSKKTLGDYVNKATSGLKGAATQGFMAGANQGKNAKVSDKAHNTAVKRIRGIRNAVSRLTKD